MAIFRPEPHSDKRPIFNVLHFLVGVTAHVASGKPTSLEYIYIYIYIYI